MASWISYYTTANSGNYTDSTTFTDDAFGYTVTYPVSDGNITFQDPNPALLVPATKEPASIEEDPFAWLDRRIEEMRVRL